MLVIPSSDVYHISDTHFDHAHPAIWQARGYESPEHMTAMIMESLWKVLTPETTLVHHGDVTVEGQWKRGIELIGSLPGKKRLLIGNHEMIFPQKRQAHKYFGEYAEVYDSIQLFSRHKLDGHQYLTAHMPYWPNDRHVARLRQWRAFDEGLPIVHGHTHSVERQEWPRHFNVAWDAWGRPVAQEEILEWLRSIS